MENVKYYSVVKTRLSVPFKTTFWSSPSESTLFLK